MDEPSWSGAAGEVIDTSGHHNNGTAVGTTLGTTMADSHSGRAGSFAAGSCVQVPTNASLQPTTALTMAAWVRADAALGGTNALGIFSKRVSDQVNGEFTMFLLSNQLYVDIGTSRSVDDVTFITYGQWHHVAAVFYGNLASDQNLRLYVDGKLDKTLAAGLGSIPSHSPEPDLYVGCLILDDEPFSETFVGGIDQAALWTRALSADEIMAIYQLTGPL